MGGGVGGCSAWEGKMTYLGEGFLWGTGGRGVAGNYAHKKWPKVCETRLSSSNSRTYWNQICVCLKHNFKEKLPLLQIISFGERNIEIGKCVSKVKSVTVILYLCQQISIELNHIWMTMMMMMMNCFLVWLTGEIRLALFPAGMIVRHPHHRESLTRRGKDLNLRRTRVQA